MQVEFMNATPLHIVAKAIRECYNSHDKSDTTYNYETNEVELGEKDRELINKVGRLFKHESVLEHLVFNIRIKGVSRLLLQEFARHRIASLSVKSTRFTLWELKDEEPFRFEGLDGEKENRMLSRASKYIVTVPREKFDTFGEYRAFVKLQIYQLELLRAVIENGAKKDVAKYLVPDSYRTNIAWTINARSLRNFLNLRSAKNAHFEIRELAYTVYDKMPEEYKYLFTDCIH